MHETHWNFYTSNPEAWEAMLLACENAKVSIDLELFIFVADEIGNKFIEVCTRKAKEGVRVRFLWDAAGSFTFFGSSIAEDLKKKGIELLFFKNLFPGFFNVPDYRSWYFRDHRRTIVIDGVVGFTGSICIYKYTENWRDTMVRIEGPVVKDMQKYFNLMWDRARGKKIGRKKAQRIMSEVSDHEFRYVTNSPLPRGRFLYSNVVEAIRHARKYIYITTPYFVPTHRLSRVLRLAAHRGVDVKILIPQSSDYPIVDIGARTFFQTMLKSGVKIFLYKERMLHSKTIIIDGDWSTVGTLNLDNISLLYNFEANLVSTNSKFAEELASHFIYDLTTSTEITRTRWKNRSFLEKLFEKLIHLVRKFL